MRPFVRLTILLLVLGAGALPLLPTVNSAEPELTRQFNQTVRPFLTTYCAGCHSGSEPAASFDVQRYATMESVVNDFGHWALLSRKLESKEMPPTGAKQPSEEMRRAVIEWIAAVRKHEANKRPGDPGLVAARRLSNAEYNYTMRDLLGVDLRPAREFPIDPANQAGFDNSSESLTISPALMAKYLDAAKRVSDHLVLTPTGFTFASHPMLVESDREKYPIQRIVAFYDRQPTDFADYFQAAWQYKHRVALGQSAKTLNDIAALRKVSPRYLPLVWQALEQTKEEVGPLVKLQAMWRALPAPQGQQADVARPNIVREHCEQMRDYVVRIRRHTEKLFHTPEAPGVNVNYQPLVMQRNKLLAAHRRDFDRASLREMGREEGEPPPQNFLVTQGPPFGRGEIEELKNKIAAYTKARLEDPDLIIPKGERARYEAAFARFSNVFPTEFCLRERGRFYPINTMDRERYLGAGLHSALGYFRDDAPLRELILDETATRELDALWDEFEFIGDYTLRNYTQFLGGSARTMDVNRDQHRGFATTAAIAALRDQHLARPPAQADTQYRQAVQEYFDNANAAIRRIEKARLAAEPLQLEALLKFAARAYRRPLVQSERDEFLTYYRQLREQNTMTHEEAMRAAITSLLVSPEFLYRVDLSDAQAKTTASAAHHPLSAYSLASRLSYFLWSSMPDDELLAHAAAGDLDKPAVLTAQVRRMLKDERARGLATEFAGAWLDFRRFDEHNAVDRERFPAFTNQLREAMYEEPIRFITDLMQRDRPVQELLYGKHTFVNGTLAQHYGMPVTEKWVRVDNAHEYGRGGLLPMAVFMTRNAPGQRTSPVKRGYWIARRVLGEAIPPPPPTVPELPRDEAATNLSVRELLVKHRDNIACAGCHARFDSFGVVFEGFGPIGERRTRDLAGRAVDIRADFPDGRKGIGIAGLQTYIRAHREQDFLNNLNEKLLTYGLGRSLLITDEPLLETMRAKLSASGYKMTSIIETIVTSPQFLNKRGAPAPSRASSRRDPFPEAVPSQPLPARARAHQPKKGN